MRFLLTFLFIISFTPLFAQTSVSISYSNETEHAAEWMEATTNWTGLPVGANFPSKKFTTIDGKGISIPESGKKLYVVHFWFIGCGAFKTEEANLNRLREAFKDQQDVAFVSFCSSPIREVKQYIKESDGFGFDIVPVGSKKKTKNLFKVTDSTTHMLVNEKGEIVSNFTSAINFEEMYELYKIKIQANL